ncbi:DNA binding [Melia azedarach]|uniref:DNA binding n=1 Tax=Melia azedarach TaxID=155640 RepID=A0ACC1YA88_MELAZ|nr:DNA binding [Melia azedarach]
MNLKGRRLEFGVQRRRGKQWYQSSNDGHFPSLNLTHKEVGGSFYTVREIVREIIQENRVLGPAKLTSEELNTNQFDEEYPLGTISTEPETPLDIKSNGSAFVPHHLEGGNQELVSNSDELCGENENQILDNEQIINGNMSIEQSTKSTCEELRTSKSAETEEKVERLAASTAKVTPISSQVVVETFPLRPVPKTDVFSGSRSGVKNATETLEENEIEKVDLEPGNGNTPLDQMENSGLLDEKKEKALAGVVLDRNSALVDNKAIEKLADPQLKSSDCSTLRETVRDTVVGIGRDAEVEVSHDDVLTSEINEENKGISRNEEVSGPNGKIPNGTYASSTKQESRTPKANVIQSEVDAQHKETSRKGSKPTVDRIPLESWERASRNSGEMETNPLLAIFKSFVTAFVKFWSE